jgi:DNA-binding CsgD family transcriptional regulator
VVGTAGQDGHDEVLERQRELAQIERCLRAAGSGRGGTLLASGPAGIGKTTLLRAAARQAAAAGLQTTSVAGSEFEGAIAFGLARQMADAVGGAAPHDNPTALLQAVARAATRRSLLLIADDVQWADPGSLRFLAGLAQRLEGSPSVLAIGVRTGERASDPAALDGLTARAAWRLRPPPLTAAGARILVDRAFGTEVDPAFAAACFAATGGNPLGLAELSATLRQEGVVPTADALDAVQEAATRTTARLVRRRLRGLAPDAVRAAEAVAVLGSAAAPGLVAELAGLGPASVRAALRDLVDAELLRASGDPVRFVHPMRRAAVLDAMAPDRQSALRLAASAALVERGSLEAAAEQLLEVDPTGDDDRARLLERAAMQAAGRGAPETVIALLQRALAEPPAPATRARLLAALGAAQAELGSAAAADTLAAALEAAGDAQARATIAGTLSWALAARGQGAEGVSVLEDCRRSIGDDGPPEVLAALDAQLVDQGGWEIGLRSARTAAVGRLRSAAQPTAIGRAALLSAQAHDAMGACRPATEVVELAEQALADEALIDDLRAAPMLATIAYDLAVAGRPDVAEERLRRAVQRWRARNAMIFVRAGGALLGMIELERGRLRDAELALRPLIASDPLAAEASPLLRATPLLIGLLVRCLVGRGRADEAAGIVRDAGLDGTMTPMVPATPMLHARGLMRVAQGDVHGARADFEHCGSRLRAEGNDNPAVVPWRSALAAIEVDPARRCALTEEELALAERFGAPHVVGAALAAHGAAVGGDDGLALLERAVATLEATFARLRLADACYALGSAQLEAGDPVTARAALRRAFALARELGAGPLGHAAARSLHAAGGRPGRRDEGGAGPLTPAERRVAVLAAEGARNRDIADELFLSPKTVESHLRAVYRKLAIGSRAELPQALAALGSR